MANDRDPVSFTRGSAQRIGDSVRTTEQIRRGEFPGLRRKPRGGVSPRRWAKTKQAWVNVALNGSYVPAHPVDSWEGDNEDTATDLTIYLPRNGLLLDPNIVNDAVIPYIIDANGDAICDGDYLDGTIAKSVEIWEGDPTAVATDRPGWVVFTRLEEKSLVIWKTGSTDYGCTACTGGFTWHGTTENNHPDHCIAHCHSYGTYDCVEEGVPWSGFAWRSTAPGQGSGTTPYTGAQDGLAADATEHTGPYNTNEDTDNRPPWGVVVLIIRNDNSGSAP